MKKENALTSILGKLSDIYALPKKMNNLSHSVMLGLMLNPCSRYRKGVLWSLCQCCYNSHIFKIFLAAPHFLK